MNKTVACSTYCVLDTRRFHRRDIRVLRHRKRKIVVEVRLAGDAGVWKLAALATLGAPPYPPACTQSFAADALDEGAFATGLPFHRSTAAPADCIVAATHFLTFEEANFLFLPHYVLFLIWAAYLRLGS